MRVSLDSADPSQHNQHRNSSTINFSLYTPDSPTAVYDFEEIARSFPLPSNESSIPSGRTGRDRDIDPSDFPVEIAPADEEDDLGRDLGPSFGDSRRGSQSWKSKDLAAWRSQCHRDANVSAVSLPAVVEQYPAAAAERNLSVISLPTVMPDSSGNTAASGIFAPSPLGDQTFTGIQQDYRIKSSAASVSAFPASDQRLSLSEDEYQTSPRNSQGKRFHAER